MRIGLIGGVNSTRVTFEKLLEHGLPPACVYAYEPRDASGVSSYVRMSDVARRRDIPSLPFSHIRERADDIASHELDVIFVVGLSQLVPATIIASARLGCIGFHPTLLPRGRGRAPVSWLVLEESAGAANLFLIDEGADSGPIFTQKRFEVDPGDDAQAVECKALDALAASLDEWLPKLRRGEWNPVPQDEFGATEYGRRCPEDGWIDWHRDASSIDRLVKASTRPHPGAYTFAERRKVQVWKSEVERTMPIRGVVGRVLKLSAAKGALVQTGEGLLWLNAYEIEDGSALRVGMRLGYYHEMEIYEIRRELDRIKEKLG